MDQGLPRAALLTIWLNAWLRGEESADDLLAHIDDGWEPRVHVVLGLPGTESPQPLPLVLGRLRAGAGGGARIALARAGDPAGLGGPPAFNLEALESGEAVLLPDARLGLIPVRIGGAVEWRCMPAAAPPYVDRGESSAALLRALHDTTDLFADLDVAAWQPDIPDRLLAGPRATPERLPRTIGESDRSLLDRALLSLDLVELAGERLGGALSGVDLHRCHTLLGDLDRAARRTLIALC